MLTQISEDDFHKILWKKGLLEECRKIYWKHWNLYQIKHGGDKESLENFITAVIEKGCKASCYS